MGKKILHKVDISKILLFLSSNKKIHNPNSIKFIKTKNKIEKKILRKTYDRLNIKFSNSINELRLLLLGLPVSKRSRFAALNRLEFGDGGRGMRFRCVPAQL